MEPQPDSSSSSIPSSPILEARNLLNRRILVGIKDGRFFLGNFYCLDKQGNIILQDAVEFRSVRRGEAAAPMEQRGFGLILIPRKCRVSCHVGCGVEDEMANMSV